MKKLIPVFLLFLVVFLTSIAKANYLPGECFILYSNIKGETYMIKLLRRESCSFYYGLMELNFHFVYLEKINKGSEKFHFLDEKFPSMEYFPSPEKLRALIQDKKEIKESFFPTKNAQK